MVKNTLALIVCVTLAACGPDKPAPVAQPTAAPTEPAPVTPEPTPSAVEPTPDPVPPPPPPAPPPPTPEELLGQLATTHAAGMKPLGGPIAQTLAAGGTFDSPVTFAAGKCYTVIAASAGVTELDIELLVAQPPLPETSFASDSTTGSTAVVGGDGKCIKNTLGIGGKGKVRLKATTGSGAVVAQVYVK